MTDQQQTDASPACGQSASTELLERFEAWWENQGQYCRAGGGDYEKTFAFRAWEAATAVEREACAELSDNFPRLFGFHSCFSVAREIRKREAL